MKLIVLGLTSVIFGLASASSYGDDSNSYGPQKSYGNPHARTYNYYPPPPPPPPSKDMEPKDELDKLYSRFEDVLDQLKTVDEKLDAMTSRLARQRQVVQELVKVTLAGFKSTDETQDSLISNLQDRMAALLSEIDEVSKAIYKLDDINDRVQSKQTKLKNDIVARWSLDITNNAELEGLKIRVRWLKEKLLQEIRNEFQVVRQSIARSASALSQIITFNSRRKCEIVKVTLDGDDRRAEYLFQQKYTIVPSVHHGLCGFNFNIDSKDEGRQNLGHNPYSYNPYGGYRQPKKPSKEPHAIGLSTSVFASHEGLTIEMFDTGFGDSTLVTTDVCAIVCSIGPDDGPVDH